MRISDWSSDVCSSDLGASGFELAPVILGIEMRIIQVSRGSMDATPARRSSKWYPCTGRQDIAGRYPLVPHAPWISSVHSAQRHVLWSAQVGSEHIDNERITPLRDLVHHDQCKTSAMPRSEEPPPEP